MQVNVLLTGRLTGMGRQAECEMLVKRSGPKPATYTDPVIIHVGEDLPDGEYTLHFENISMPVVHKGVLWTVSAPPREHVADKQKPESGRGASPAGGPIEMAR